MSPAKRAKKRRQYTTGSVYQRASDGRWYGTIEAGFTKTGARRRVIVTAATMEKAKSKLRDKQLEIAKEGVTDADARTNVKHWSDEWLAIIERKLRPKTLAGYTSAVKLHIVTSIGHRPLAALTPRDIRKVADDQRAKGLSSSTQLHTHAVLMKMLRAAQVDGHAVPARVMVLDRPTPAVHDRTGIPLMDALDVLRVAFDLDHFSRWYAALVYGMRQGECLGLTWDQVDLDAGQMAVSWQLQALPYLDRKAGTFKVPDGYEVRHLVGAQHLVRPKTSKGWRVMPMVGHMGPALEKWRRDSPESPHGLVWPAVSGAPANVKHDLDEWKGLQGTAGIGHPSGRYYVLHEARNTAATLLMEAKVSNEVITAILGHSSIVTSRGYMHVNQEQARAAMERVVERLQLGPAG